MTPEGVYCEPYPYIVGDHGETKAGLMWVVYHYGTAAWSTSMYVERFGDREGKARARLAAIQIERSYAIREADERHEARMRWERQMAEWKGQTLLDRYADFCRRLEAATMRGTV